MNDYIDLSRLAISSQDEDNTYIGIDENGNVVRTKIAVGDGNVDVDLSDYYTKSEVDKKIDNIDVPEVDLSNYYTKQEINNKGYVTDSDVNEYVGNEIEQLEELIKTKQTKLVSGTNIKTVNGVSLLGSGDVSITSTETDLSNYYTKDEVDEKIDNIETSDIDLSDYYTKTEIDGKIVNLVPVTRWESTNTEMMNNINRIDNTVGDINNILTTI